MTKLLKIVKGILAFVVANIIGAILLFYIEPIVFQESSLESYVQVLIILGVFFVFLIALIHLYLKNRVKDEIK